MKKRTLSRLFATVLSVCLLLSTASMGAAAAPADDQLKVAQALNSLNLLHGYDETGTNLGLTDVPTREQALALQICLLGEEADAKAWTGTSPYGDVAADSWFLPYAGYAASKGYTKGVGGGNFGMGQPVTPQSMVTFILRGMGYSDTAATPDFTYDTSLLFGLKLGICEAGTTSFTRGDVVLILANAFATNCKDGELLSAKLAKKGIFTQADLDKAMAILDTISAPVATPPATTTPPAGDRNVTLTFVNNTGLSFKELYATASGEETWGTTNLLTGAGGTSISLVFPVSATDYLFDMKFVDSRGYSFVAYELDFSTTVGDKTIHLELTEGGELAFYQ